MSKVINVAGAVIVNKDGKILCAQRGDINRELAGMWEFAGGKIEAGETPEQACKREIQEELKIEIEVGEKIVTSSYDYDFGTVVMTTFYCKMVDDEAEPKRTEHAEFRWLKPAELNTLNWAPVDKEAVEIIAKRGVK
ncbi:MAG: (deoxy)nucleoside triphosphate pyrophosphohydrolase [Candidatus Ancillula sp.]|jgi:8-oxo-dGTP diphosphatase|nr:(deoxy)nucleoside triphosphate pyrophosphohydrolase [Candidatus Ancillula sp.]